jgi:hypothetical protein
LLELRALNLKFLFQEENISIRVKVDGKTLLVPINSRTLTFGALAEKVAERYLK